VIANIAVLIACLNGDPVGTTSAPPPVELVGNGLVFHEHLYFETDSPRILPVSYPLLDAVSAHLRQHPDIKQLIIHVHDDNKRGNAHALVLTQRRARAFVRYFRAHGAPVRVRACGFGARYLFNKKNPRSPSNRRVVFTVRR
jgi:outer membrane protein OmpA-like peptidoglycan-associated protein